MVRRTCATKSASVRVGPVDGLKTCPVATSKLMMNEQAPWRLYRDMLEHFAHYVELCYCRWLVTSGERRLGESINPTAQVVFDTWTASITQPVGELANGDQIAEFLPP
jgi:hypothetical protein